jgi:hypothetical protein
MRPRRSGELLAALAASDERAGHPVDETRGRALQQLYAEPRFELLYSVHQPSRAGRDPAAIVATALRWFPMVFSSVP